MPESHSGAARRPVIRRLIQATLLFRIGLMNLDASIQEANLTPYIPMGGEKYFSGPLLYPSENQAYSLFGGIRYRGKNG